MWYTDDDLFTRWDLYGQCFGHLMLQHRKEVGFGREDAAKKTLNQALLLQLGQETIAQYRAGQQGGSHCPARVPTKEEVECLIRKCDPCCTRPVCGPTSGGSGQGRDHNDDHNNDHG